jgi:hypothetical protein
MNRPANGRFELDRGFDPDYIPAGPSYRPTLLPSLHQETERRPRDIRSSFDKEKGELSIQLQYAEPLMEEKRLEEIMKWAEGTDSLRKISISVAQEVYAATSSFSWFRRHGFERNDARGFGDFIVVEKSHLTSRLSIEASSPQSTS